MCAAEACTGWDEWLDLPLANAAALIRAVGDKIARADAMQASVARMIYLSSSGRRRQARLSEFMLFS